MAKLKKNSKDAKLPQKRGAKRSTKLDVAIITLEHIESSHSLG